MKTVKAEVKITDIRMWCEYCCVRIAPHEGHIEVGGKAYHPRCHSHLPSAIREPKA